MAFFDKIPYMILIAIAVFMLLAPFRPMPHVIEKLIMLKNGNLTKPIDIFDLFYHFFSNDYIVIEGLQGLFEIGDDPKSRQPALEKVFNGQFVRLQMRNLLRENLKKGFLMYK